MAGLASKFKAVWRSQPLLSNCITYGLLYGGAEFSQQTLIRKVFPETPETYDFKLVGQYFTLGSTVFPAFLYYWYKFLDPRMLGKTPMGIAAKVVVDQLVTAPPILATFYVGMSVMEGKKDVFAECKEKFLPTLKTSCQFWMPAQAINFMFVPSPMRVVYIGSCSLLWVNILCVLKRNNSNNPERN